MRDCSNRLVKRVLEIMSLLCFAVALLVYLFAPQLGLSEDTAFYVAIAFLIAGIGDFIALKFWDRIGPQG